jgi:peptidoglycan hydrolase CwlO-like protein
MKKVIFALVFASIFFVASLVLAKDNSSEDSLAEAWITINSLKGQVAELQTEIKTLKNQSEFNTASENSIKIPKNIPQSEHYVMNGLSIQ